MFRWCREAGTIERRTVRTCLGGWSLDTPLPPLVGVMSETFPLGAAIGAATALAYSLVLLALLLLPGTRGKQLDADALVPVLAPAAAGGSV